MRSYRRMKGLLGALATLAALVGLPLLATGCGGSHDGAATGRTKVRLVYHPQLLPAYAKEKPDLFAKPLAAQGIDVEWVDVQGSHAPAIAAVIGGSADVSSGGTTAVALASIANGQDVRISAIGVTKKSNGGILAYPGSGIDSVEGLRGKTIAVSKGGFGELTLVVALKKHHMTRDDVKIVYLSLDDGAAAFAARQVDAYIALGNKVQIATVQHGAKLIFDVDNDLTPQESIISGNTICFVVRGDFAKAHADVLAKVFKAYQRVGQWADQHPDAAFAINQRINRYPPGITDALRQKFAVYQLIYPLGAHDIDLLQKSADFLAEQHVLPKRLNAKTIVTEQ